MFHATCGRCRRADQPWIFDSLAALDAHAATHPTHGLNAPTDHTNPDSTIKDPS